MWIWDQSEGKMYRANQDGSREWIANGYSGHDVGKNNPNLEGTVATGPIPSGNWKITAVKNSPNTGPYTLVLEPDGHNALGRSAFRIHGDSAKAPGTASHGCIILPRTIREQIWESGERSLLVVH